MVIDIDTQLGAAIDRTMRYYALFKYPLQVHEIRNNCGMPCDEEEVEAYLHEQVMHGNIFCMDGYYTLLPDVTALLERRIKGREKAMRDIKVAKAVGRLIYQCPFVSFVGISGSLSKGYSDRSSDCDFFIITRRNRMWISRSLLHIIKKLSFMIGQQHKLCMNYFIDESALTIQEKNVYTATELNSLIPVCGSEMHYQFMQANSWVKNYLPNYSREEPRNISDRASIMKSLLAGVFNLVQPETLNKALMKFTDAKWRKKWARRGYPAEDYELAFKTRLGISKNHKANYQKKILEAIAPAEL
jgi:hypothetical protein